MRRRTATPLTGPHPPPRSPRVLSTDKSKPAAPATLARFLHEARTLDPEQLAPMRADPLAVQHNVGLGVAAVLAFTDHLREHLPHVDLDELRSLPELALYLFHASAEVDGAGDEAAEIRALLPEAQALLRLLHASALALAEAGVLTPREAAKLPAHRGVDPAAGCLALAALFERRAEDVAGQTPVTEEQLARAAELGASLRALQKPRAAARKATADGPSPVEVRDRLWTLLVTRHERLWAVGAYVYGHAVAEHVPALTAPVAVTKGKRAAKA